MWPFKRKIEVAIGPPEGGGSARGYERFNKNGERETVIIGEKFPLRGHSRGTLLGEGGKIDKIKDMVKMGIKLLSEVKKEEIPHSELKMPVRAVAEVFDELIEAEGYEYVRQNWVWLKKVLVSIAEEDDNYCFRMQWFFEQIAKRIKDIRLTKADKYYFYARPGFNWNPPKKK